MLDHFLDYIVAKWIVHQRRVHQLHLLVLALSLARAHEDLLVEVNNFVVNSLLAQTGALRAVPIVDFNQHFLHKTGALLIAAAVSS